jgi:hypothetical protein
MNKIACGTLGIVTLLLIVAADAGAQATYLGPTAYTSRADSPFETATFGFCVEDFENGKFDVPGATGNGTAIGPGGLTDSVDGDDGTIDGSGTGGRSYFSGSGLTGIIVTFDVTRTNGLPTEVGIVWTDGGLNADVTFEAFDADGVSLLGPNGPNAHADASNGGTTAEDRFYGATNPTGISKIVVSNPGGGIEVDHIQLDRCILCGDANGDLDVTATDALFALSVSVGIETCDPCICDANDDGGTSVTDALAILRTAVGSGPTMNCPACEVL